MILISYVMVIVIVIVIVMPETITKLQLCNGKTNVFNRTR